VKALIELAKQADELEWTPERRERTFRRVLARVRVSRPVRPGDPRMTFVPSN
jgi:hypothetical protein